MSGIAAICALAAIPVSVLVAHWQKRAALEQAETAHRTALAQAEAAHRNSLEAAEKAHQQALEMLARQNEREVSHWSREARYAAYGLFQNALARARLAFLAEPVDEMEALLAREEVHQMYHQVVMVASDRVAELVKQLVTPIRFWMGAANPRERWDEQVAPLRRELDEAIREELQSEPEWYRSCRGNPWTRDEP